MGTAVAMTFVRALLDIPLIVELLCEDGVLAIQVTCIGLGVGISVGVGGSTTNGGIQDQIWGLDERNLGAGASIMPSAFPIHIQQAQLQQKD